MLRSLLFILTFIVLTLGFGAAPAAAHPTLPTQATYLGNEGIMVSDDHTTVLFDPLFPNGFGIYQMVPETMRQDLMAGIGPYEDVDAIFISHMHPDHFSVGETVIYMQTHEKVRLFAPAQAVQMMRDDAPEAEIFDRITSVGLERLDAPLSFKQGALEIDVVRIPHAGWPQRSEVSNLVWRVTLADGITVTHLGDADPRRSHFDPHEAHWMAKRTDTVYPPYWFFLMGDGPQILSMQLNTRQATAIHVPIELPPDLFASGGDYFHRPGETRVLKKASGE